VSDDRDFARLLDAVRLVAGDLDLETVLERIVEAACTLVDARYGALGVIADDGVGLSAFVHHGIDDATVEAIGRLPAGRGVLGHLISHPHPLRLDDVSSHDASYGFPPNHPPMRSFLGAPIRIGERVFGNLYLTDKRAGEVFTASDEELIVALAAVAGAVINNARLYEDLRRRETWRGAVLELAESVLAGDATGEMQERATALAQRLLDAEVACLVARVDAATDDRLVVLAARGDGAPALGRVDGAGSAVLRTLDHGEVVRADHGILLRRPVMWVPVRHGGDVHAALGVGRSTPFSTRDEQLLVGFGEQVSVAWSHERAQSELRRLSLIEDRERIGRDLHDTVIQRLFATGLSLQAIMPRVNDRPEVVGKLGWAVDELDHTVKDIRATIFALQARDEERGGLRGKILAVVDDVADALGAVPRVRFDGPIDVLVPDDVGEVAVPVVREALTNVAKHAKATEVIIELSVAAGVLTVRVIDDGIGLGPGDSGGFGLHNLSDRATALRGRFSVASRADGPGTELSWSVPVSGTVMPPGG
jgi:two-component system, NarL family, sensor histidine kinase DevS